MAYTKTPVNQASFLLRYSLQSFGVILLLAILIRAFLLSSYAMSGSAMLPTIWPGDFLVAVKWRLSPLYRGEVVALRCPFAKEKLCMKRVIGLPGDRVELKGAKLVINGQEALHRKQGTFETESFTDGAWAIWPDPTSSGQANEPVVVPPQSVFLMNDKRSDRDDSRQWGAVSEDMLEARILRVWMSLDWYDGERVRSWPRVRWPRLLRSID